MALVKWKFKHYVMVVVMVILLAVLTYALLSTYNTYTEMIIEQQQQHLLIISRAVSKNLDLYLSEQIRDIEILVKTPGFVNEMRGYYEAGEVGGTKEYILSYMLSHYKGLSRIYLLDRYGNEIFRYNQYPFLEEFDEGLLELPRLSDMERNGIGGMFEISPNHYGVSIVNIIYAGDDYLGCVIGLVDMDTLYSQFVSPLDFRESDYLMVKDETGTVIMHPNKEMIGFNYFSDLGDLSADARYQGLEAMLNRQYEFEEGTSIYRSYSGNILPAVEEISAYTRVNLSGTTWFISAVMPISQALQPINQNLSRFALLGVVTFAIVAIAIVIIYSLQKNRQRLTMQTRYLQDINNTLEELHQSKEQVRHYQKLQTIGALAGGIAHEFNNLLTPIMGYCEFLQEQFGPESEYADDLEEIHKAGSRAKEIIEQILPFSRRESDTSGYTAVSVDAIVRDAAKTVRMILPSSIVLEENIQVNGLNVFGSASQLNQVLLNLCTNAYQSMEPDGGTMRLSCVVVSPQQLPEQYRGVDPSGKYVMLTVSDTGCGMCPEIAERVFDPFFTTKEVGEGTGLGLSVVQSIIQSHAGVITLDTEQGKGSRFCLYLPTTNAPVLPKDKKIRSEMEESARVLNILLVDDEQRIVKYLQKRLRGSGYAVQSYTSSEKALTAFHEAPDTWDLVILDYTMPKYKGTELAKQMKKRRPELPVYLITGLVEKEALHMKQTGILDEILIKPLDYNELLRAVQRI